MQLGQYENFGLISFRAPTLQSLSRPNQTNGRYPNMAEITTTQAAAAKEKIGAAILSI
jgi:hypothetical protein